VQTCAPICPLVQAHETEAPGAHTFPVPPPPHPTMIAARIAAPIVDRAIRCRSASHGAREIVHDATTREGNPTERLTAPRAAPQNADC